MAYADRLRRALYGLQRQFQDTPDRDRLAQGTPSGVRGLGPGGRRPAFYNRQLRTTKQAGKITPSPSCPDITSI